MVAHHGKFVAYYRVSTDKRGHPGPRAACGSGGGVMIPERTILKLGKPRIAGAQRFRSFNNYMLNGADLNDLCARVVQKLSFLRGVCKGATSPLA
jgi:hypothetical protein